MDRIIEVKVSGNYLSKDNKNAGVKGEANATNLRIAFDEGWDGYAKKVTFWNALGGNPVERTLTADLIENIVESIRVYIVPIPGEAMTEAGKLTFVIDGYVDGKRQRSIADKLEVKDAPIADTAGKPADPTPTQAEQLQGQIDTLMSDIQAERQIVDEVSKTITTALEITETNARTTTADAKLTGQYKEDARESAESAAESNAKAQETLGKTNYIGENGNWFAWDSKVGAFYDTGVRAQSGSVVYCGENPPDDADVWIAPGENPLGYYNIEETNALLDEVRRLVVDLSNKVAKTPYIITLYKDRWTLVDKNKWHQEIDIPNTTEHSMVDFMTTDEQFNYLVQNGILLYTVNDGGNVFAVCEGAIPLDISEIKVTVSEVVVGE